MRLPLFRGITALAVAVTFLSLASFSARAEQINENYAYRTPLLLTGIAASAWAMTSNSVEKDKKQHFGISAVMGFASESFLRSGSFRVENRWQRVALATGMATVPGIAKELADSKFDTGDLLADVIGSFTGAMLSDLMQGPVSNFHVGLGKDSIRIGWAGRF